MAAFFRLALVVMLCVAAMAGSVWYLRLDFIYMFDKSGLDPVDMPRTEVRQIPAHGPAPALTVWVTEPEPGYPIIIYFMGEAGSLSVYEGRLRLFAEAGFGIAAMAYRGGGGQPGTADEAAFHRDARRVYAGLHNLFGREISDNERVIYGFSLGTGIAARLAAEQEELALVLEAPYTRLCEADLGMGGMLPGCLLMRGQDYQTIDFISQIDTPLLVLHGAADPHIPIDQGQRVFRQASEPKFMQVFQAGHDDLPRAGAADEAMSFIRVLSGIR